MFEPVTDYVEFHLVTFKLPVIFNSFQFYLPHFIYVFLLLAGEDFPQCPCCALGHTHDGDLFLSFFFFFTLLTTGRGDIVAGYIAGFFYSHNPELLLVFLRWTSYQQGGQYFPPAGLFLGCFLVTCFFFFCWLFSTPSPPSLFSFPELAIDGFTLQGATPVLY